MNASTSSEVLAEAPCNPQFALSLADQRDNAIIPGFLRTLGPKLIIATLDQIGFGASIHLFLDRLNTRHA